MYGVLPARLSGYHLHVVSEEVERGIRPPVVELQNLLARGGVVVKWRGGDLGTEPRPSVRAAYEPSLQPLKVFSHFPATSVFLILRSL